MAATEEGELISEDLLTVFERDLLDLPSWPWPYYMKPVPGNPVSNLSVSREKVILPPLSGELQPSRRPLRKEDYGLEARLSEWRKECEEGRGLVLQRELVVRELAPPRIDREFFWDEKGKRAHDLAEGVHQIVGAHLGRMFLAPQLDIYVCSMCGRPFPFDDQPGVRRPKRGARRF